MTPSAKSMLYLSRADILQVGGGSSALYVAAVEQALRLHAAGQFAQPLKPCERWRSPEGHLADRIIAMPAYLGGKVPVAGLRWSGSKHDNPARHGLERASALVVLNDAQTHYPIAIMEGSLLSAMRRAAVTAVAARHLARRRFRCVACLGCGEVARAQLVTLLEQFPSASTLALYDVRPEAAELLARELRERFAHVDWRITGSAEDAIRRAEVVITCTSATRSYIPFDWLSRGCFVSNVSVVDVNPEVFLGADKVVVDDWELSRREKKAVNPLAQERRFSREDLHAELGEVVAARRPGRERDDEVIILHPAGMAIEDIACAQALYHEALEAGAGTWLSLV